ncbi:hypothetical protein DH2020_004965 [Rehmannia glutinosa]|uniref:F-box domain-containing protein n=1 Tax=Rehmannia glutinosa TaxID=99300 RepID=A0ABR0XQZ6_REHGL
MNRGAMEEQGQNERVSRVRTKILSPCSVEKQAPEREDDDGSSYSMDRISQLPQPILHHILSFLSQNEAAQTSLLSKSWRYLWSTLPNIEFREDCFNGNKETFLSVLDKTLQGYHDQKLCIQEFGVKMWKVDSESIPLLEKWIPIVTLNMGVKNLSICLDFLQRSAYFDLPLVIFEAKSLQDLYLGGCKLSQNNPLDKVLFKNLRTLYLNQVYVTVETFEKIISNCTLIEYVTLHGCKGLRTIKVNKLHKYLKCFDFSNFYGRYTGEEDDRSIEIDVPTVETIKIVGCNNWYHHHKYFLHLKSLYLNKVRLSSKSFDFFSCNYLPSLKYLTLSYCNGFNEFHLFNRSIEHLIFDGMMESNKASVDVPNIVMFECEGEIPESFSFNTTSIKWKSNVILWSYVNSDNDASSWFLKINSVLQALSQSEISLGLLQFRWKSNRLHNGEDPPGHKPVLVAQLKLGFYCHESFSFSSAFISNLFRVCRPRYMVRDMYTNARDEFETKHNQLTEFLSLILHRDQRDECPNINCQEMRHDYFWRHDLEEVSMEVFYQNGKEWHRVEGTSSLESAAAVMPNSPQKVRFGFKWKEIS